MVNIGNKIVITEKSLINVQKQLGYNTFKCTFTAVICLKPQLNRWRSNSTFLKEHLVKRTVNEMLALI